MSMSLAMKVGLGVGAATAIGGFVAHEQLEDDGKWTSANSKLSMMTQLGVIGGATSMMATHMATGKQWSIGVGTGILFGGLTGALVANVGAMLVD